MVAVIKPRVASTAHPRNARHWMVPFAIVLTGVLLDYISTTIGLSWGLSETHLQYHPVWAGLVFSFALALLTCTLPKDKWGRRCITSVALCSYLGAVNNVFVLLGIFPGFS